MRTINLGDIRQWEMLDFDEDGLAYLDFPGRFARAVRLQVISPGKVTLDMHVAGEGLFPLGIYSPADAVTEYRATLGGAAGVRFTIWEEGVPVFVRRFDRAPKVERSGETFTTYSPEKMQVSEADRMAHLMRLNEDRMMERVERAYQRKLAELALKEKEHDDGTPTDPQKDENPQTDPPKEPVAAQPQQDPQGGDPAGGDVKGAK